MMKPGIAAIIKVRAIVQFGRSSRLTRPWLGEHPNCDFQKGM